MKNVSILVLGVRTTVGISKISTLATISLFQDFLQKHINFSV